MFNLPLTEKLATAGIVAVVTVENPENGVQVTCALLAGGNSAIALTLRTPVAA